jgi:predicted MPP superfamily phosphohydrolase
MLTFLSVALLIYGSMHFYALAKVWQAFPHSLELAVALALGGLVMTLSPLIVWFIEQHNWHGATVAASWGAYLWMGFLLLFCCIALAFDLGHALATLLSFKYPLNDSMALLAAVLLALAALGYGFVEARQIRVETVTITTPKLASGRVTIAQLSDLHLGVMQGDEFLGRVIARLREIGPDIVVATGDIVDGQGDDLDALAKHLREFHPPHGAYAIVGNHEVYAGLATSLRFLRNAGYTVLRGESATAAGIVLVGVDDPSAAALGQEARVDTSRPPASVALGGFIVLLKHQPVVNSDMPFDLQLSGHIHGGQIFPFGLITRLSYGVHTGLTRLADGRWLYVSRGAGTWGPPIRLFAAPEITLITIQSEHK